MKEKITFAAGCFWKIQYIFEQESGVISTRVGYTGGYTFCPTYQDVCTGKTGHVEAVEIIFDNTQISLQSILKLFLKSHNPTSFLKQGADTGSQYRSVIFYHTNKQKETSLQMIKAFEKDKKCKIVTDLVKAPVFYPAEEYQQNYLIKNNLLPVQILHSDSEWQHLLTSEEFLILRKKKTEKPYSGFYNSFFQKGNYRCAGCSQKLFSSDSKFNCDCGWPSFDHSFDNSTLIKKDFSHFMIRDEVICSRCLSHLGHRFFSLETKTNQRYCINSIALDFEPEIKK
ncbi:MAG: peptide-methionine (S)-S-oxide reductase MsrA [Alphaproteobacteria bacterium]|nr:peptide-methionine (S)-S-oxide reductase MsrA [Alphaproteobacteria bacterium]